MRRKSLFAIIPSAFLIALGFSNCGKLAPLEGLMNASSQTCTAQMRAKVSVDFATSLCEDISNFKCERRVFGPGTEGPNKKEVECHSIGRKTDVCVEVSTLNFDTSGALDGAEASSFARGGEYNREEIQCWNDRIRKKNISVIQSEGDTIADALRAVIESCYERSEK